MGFIDSILDGIGKVVLFIVGLIILLASFYAIATNSTVTGFILLVVGLGVMVGAKSYSH